MKTEQMYIDLVKQYFPDLTDEEADQLLWDSTPFPMRNDLPTIGKYLEDCAKEGRRIDLRAAMPESLRGTDLSNSTRFAEFLDGLSEDQYNNFKENIKGDLQKYE